MILNSTDRYQFHRWLQLKSQNFEVVKKMKILGPIFTDRLSWNENCETLFRKVKAQMQLLRKVWSFGSNYQEMVNMWKTICASVLEQSCVVWGVQLPKQIERTQNVPKRIFVNLCFKKIAKYTKMRYTFYVSKLQKEVGKL